MFKRRYLIGFFCVLSTLSIAQTAPSPFNSIGIGRFGSDGLIQQTSSGGIGIGSGSYWNLNNLNPAMLMFNRGTLFGSLTVFQAGTVYDSKNIENATGSEKSTGAGLSYIAMGFPILPNKWFTSIGLRPFTSGNYNLNYETPFAGSPYNAAVTEEGSGGINQLYWSNGVTVTKNLAVGLKTQFLFSSSFLETANYVNTPDLPVRYTSTIYERNTAGGMLLSGGLVYQDSIKVKGKEPLKITFGLTYDLKKDVKVKQFESIQRRLISGTVWEADTTKNNVIGNLTMPSGIGFGMSISKFYNWSVGIDFKIKNYADFRKYGEDIGTQNTFFFGIGGELTPDAFSVEDYYKRVTFRAGFNYETSPYLINGMDVKDFGINFGVSLPIVPTASSGNVLNKGFSSVDMGFQYGVMGNVANNSLREEYFRVHFGVTFNDRWFVKRKFN